MRRRPISLFLSSSLSTASSIQSLRPSLPPPSPVTIPDQPLSSLFPPSLNPTHIAVDLICSAIKQQSTSASSFSPLHLKLELQERFFTHVCSSDISGILLKCQSQPLPSLSFFNWAKVHLSHKLSIHNYCIMVHILAWSRLFSQATTILSELVDGRKFPVEDIFDCLIQSTDDCNWNPAVFGMVLKVFVKMGVIEEGLRAFRRMVFMGLLPNTNECNCLLNGLIKGSFFNECWGVYEEMKSAGIGFNTYTFNIMIKVLCKCGDAGKAKEFMEEMEMEGFDPDIVTYNTLITGYCRKGRLDDAFYLYKIMYRRGVVPDSISYTVLMNGLCRGGKVKEARQFFHQMLHRGLQADAYMYNSLIVGYCNEGKMMEAKSMLQEMILSDFLPDKFTCYTLVEGCRKDGKLLLCLNLVSQLRNLGLPISFEIYRNLIDSLCKEGRPNAARNILKWTSEDMMEPNLELYNILIDGYCKGDYIAEALLLQKEMIEKGIQPNVTSYRILINCLCRIGRSNEGECLMWEMVESSNLLPDSEMCLSLLNGYCKERSCMKAESLLRTLAEKFNIRETRCYNVLIDALCEEGNVTKSFEIHDKMLNLGILPNAHTCKSLINGILQAK